MISIETIKSDIISEFSLFEDWMEKYEYIIELGKSIPLIDPKFKTDDNLIKGCQSKVWMHAEIKNNNVLFYADSDAIITKGIPITLLVASNRIKIPQIPIINSTGIIDSPKFNLSKIPPLSTS